MQQYGLEGGSVEVAIHSRVDGLKGGISWLFPGSTGPFQTRSSIISMQKLS